MKRLPLFLSIIAICTSINFLMSEGFLLVFECKNDDCGYSLFSIIVWVVLVSLLFFVVFFMPRKGIVKASSSPVGVWRRFAATYLNMLAVMFAVQFIVSFSILIIGFNYTGEISSVSYKELSDFTKGIIAFFSLIAFIGLGFYYYYTSLKNKKPTIGQYLMGYYISGKNEEWTVGRAWERFGSAMITFCIWPIPAIIAAGDPLKAFWFDRNTNSIAVNFDYATNQRCKAEEDND